MAEKPILYDPDKPVAHYGRAWKLYKSVKTALGVGIASPVVSLLCGASCILYDPRLMAYFSLFAVPFTLLSLIGCKTRRAVMCLISIPLALGAAVVSIVSGTFTAPLGLAAYLISAFAQFRAILAINNFIKLKELPGFPFFDPSMDNISFAAMDRRGTDEFIEVPETSDEKTVYRFDPEDLQPSEEMEEIVTGVCLKKDTDGAAAASESVSEVKAAEPEEASESTYEKMMKLNTEKRGEISDVELFG